MVEVSVRDSSLILSGIPFHLLLIIEEIIPLLLIMLLSLTPEEFSHQISVYLPHYFKNTIKKSGHLIDRCYKLHGFPSDFKFNKGKKHVSFVQSAPHIVEPDISPLKLDEGEYRLTKDKFQHYQHLQHLEHNSAISIPSTPHVHVAPNHSNAEFAYFAGVFNHSAVNFVAFHASVVSSLGLNPWIIDSRATNHMTPHKFLLHNSSNNTSINKLTKWVQS